jgi:biopolymer transport protein ExbD
MRLESTVRWSGAPTLAAGAATVLLLLVFYILLSGSYLLQPGTALELPSSRFLLPAMRNPLIVSVTGGAGASVYFEDRVVDPAQLGERLSSRRSVSRQVVIKADRDAPLALVAQVTELALAEGFSVALAAARPPQP